MKGEKKHFHHQKLMAHLGLAFQGCGGPWEGISTWPALTHCRRRRGQGKRQRAGFKPMSPMGVKPVCGRGYCLRHSAPQSKDVLNWNVLKQDVSFSIDQNCLSRKDFRRGTRSHRQAIFESEQNLENVSPVIATSADLIHEKLPLRRKIKRKRETD